MDSSAMDYTMHQHHPHHHYHHNRHHTGGGAAASPAAAARCPAFRAATAENRNPQLPTVSPARDQAHYDPVHGSAWQSRTPQNWQPAAISSPYIQNEPYRAVTYPTPNQSDRPVQQQHQSQCPMPNLSAMSNSPEAYSMHIPSFHHWRAPMHPAPQFLGHSSYQGSASAGYASSNQMNSGTQHPSNGHRGNTGFPNPSPTHGVNNSGEIHGSRSPAPTTQAGQAMPFVNENAGPGQQLPNVLPNIMPNPGGSSSFSGQMPDHAAAQTSSAPAGEGGEPRQNTVPETPSNPASTAPQRISNQYDRITNPVEIRRASMALMGRARRGPTRFTASPGEGFGENPYNMVRRGDLSLQEFVENFPGSYSDGEIRMNEPQRFSRNITGKRVASKRAIASLQRVNIAELSESEKTCIICYNDFGEENPEGINETPLRLPKCKHVFGDHCIKKWFEESDSCPYCRDKVHSEVQHTAHRRAHPNFRFISQNQTSNQNLYSQQGPSQSTNHGDAPPESQSSTRPGQPMPGVDMDIASSGLFSDSGSSNRPQSGSRRFDHTNYQHGARVPFWNPAQERRSPPAENDRRRRPRLRVRLTPSSTHSSATGAPTSNGVAQTSVRPSRSSRSRSPIDPLSTRLEMEMHNRPSLTTSPTPQYHWSGSPPPNPNNPNMGGTTSSRPSSGLVFDGFAFPSHSQVAMETDDFFYGLDPLDFEAPPANDFSSVLPQLLSGPSRFAFENLVASDAYPASPSHESPNQFTSYQQS